MGHAVGDTSTSSWWAPVTRTVRAASAIGGSSTYTSPADSTMLRASTEPVAHHTPRAATGCVSALGRQDPSERFKEVVHPATHHWMHHDAVPADARPAALSAVQAALGSNEPPTSSADTRHASSATGAEVGVTLDQLTELTTSASVLSASGARFSVRHQTGSLVSPQPVTPWIWDRRGERESVPWVRERPRRGRGRLACRLDGLSSPTKR